MPWVPQVTNARDESLVAAGGETQIRNLPAPRKNDNPPPWNSRGGRVTRGGIYHENERKRTHE